MEMHTPTIERNCSPTKIAAYLDGELPPREELFLETHIAVCKNCLTELNLQKKMLCALDFALDKGAEIPLPKNFAKVVATTAESKVSGLRSKKERFRALFLCVSLLLVILVGLGAETENVFSAFGKFSEQVVAVFGFVGHLFYELAFGVFIILRSLSEQFVFNSAISLPMVVGLFILSVLLFSRLIFRFDRS